MPRADMFPPFRRGCLAPVRRPATSDHVSESTDGLVEAHPTIGTDYAGVSDAFLDVG